MSLKTTWTCDQCGQVKGKTNHWFAIQRWFAKQEQGAGTPVMPVLSLICFINAKADDIHLCGEGCVMARVSMCLREISAKTDEIEKAGVA